MKSIKVSICNKEYLLNINEAFARGLLREIPTLKTGDRYRRGDGTVITIGFDITKNKWIGIDDNFNVHYSNASAGGDIVDLIVMFGWKKLNVFR